MQFDPSSMLAPDQRALYSDSLRPPPGYVFDGGIATTFSLDLEALLTIPVYLALYSVPDAREALASPVAVLEAIERTSRRLAVFVQGGRMHAVERQPRLSGLLEGITVEVTTRKGGTFHPKLWLLRFKPRDGAETRPLLRLLVLSRNLTNDRSWDVVLRLDGTPGGRNVAANHPLAAFIRALPGLAIRPAAVSPSMQEMITELAEQALRTTWELPEGFEELSFVTIGLDRRGWSLPESHRLAVISPFVDDPTLALLADSTREPALLLARPEELEMVSDATRARFGRVCVLQDAAETEDGEESDNGARRLYGLHAKIYLLDQGRRTTLIVGSGNATSPVFKSGTNVEFFALLTGRRSQIGDIESLLDAEGLGGLLVDFVRPMEPACALSQAELQAEKALDAARDALAQAGLSLNYVGEEIALPVPGTPAQTEGGSWRGVLTAPRPVAISGIRSISVWPVTSRKEQARDGLPITTRGAVDLGVQALADVCGFVAFELEAEAAERSTSFTLNVPVIGLPADRERAILRSVIEGADGFLRYLRLLLADLGEDLALALAPNGGGTGEWRNGDVGDVSLLEDLVRALSRDPDRARAVDRLIERLDGPGAGPPVVPPDFLALWAAFRALLPHREQS